MRFIVILYALAVIGGGLFGYSQSGSPASLIAGSSFGVVLLIAAGAMFGKKMWGSYLALIATFLLDSFFTWRFLKTLAFFPAGFFSLLSLIVLVLLAVSLKVRK